MQTLSEIRSHGGIQGVYRHASPSCACTMTFALFLPPQAERAPCPLLWYLSGLTCNHTNVMEKGEYRRLAAELGIAIICPDTSPRGDHVANIAEDWQIGQGAGFYLDATQAPWNKNYHMASYIAEELPTLVSSNFPLDITRQGIFGHSMGGHGALTLALKHPEQYRSVSAFAPIVNPTTADWSTKAFAAYLGNDKALWRAYDAVHLIEDGARLNELLVDQGSADSFLETGLRPHLLQKACDDANINLTLRLHEGYDHSYYFISTFMEKHLRWHAERL